MDDKNRLFQEVCLRQIQLILTVALGVSEIRWARLLDGGLFNTGLWEGNVLLDRDTHAILALIDGDRAIYGDPDFEFASSWMDVPALLAELNDL